jgi:septum formation topological specificity factor MinE
LFNGTKPQTGQTERQRLIRERHRRQILNRDRHHKNEEAAVAKMRRKILENICETVPHSAPAMFHSG